MGPSDDDDLLEADPGLASDEAGLRELESRIEKLQQPAGGGNKLFAKGVAMVTSMGFILAGCIAAGHFLGQFLAVKFGSQLFQILGLALGLAAAVFALMKLLGPFLKSEE